MDVWLWAFRAADGVIAAARRRAYRALYLRSGHWQRVRAEAIGRAGGRCAECGSRQRLDVHHLTYARLGDESRFLAYLDGPSLDQELVELFGYDWFKNPRAVEWMRARATSAADTFDEAKGAPESLAKFFERALFG